MKSKAIVLGATGLVGRSLVNKLLEDSDFSEVIILVRRNIGITNPKLKEFIIDFENLKKYHEHIQGDVLFSCMGTTIKKAGSQEAQYKVDYTYQYEVARIAASNGIKTYLLISAANANSKSILFYSKIKGQLDEAVSKLGFERTFIFRPSVLLGEREEKRTAEGISAKLINFLQKVIPSLKKYRGIKDFEVATAMINRYKLQNSENTKIYQLDELFDLQ